MSKERQRQSQKPYKKKKVLTIFVGSSVVIGLGSGIWAWTTLNQNYSPNMTVVSLADIQKATEYNPDDPTFISTLKNKAKGDYLATGSLSNYNDLKTNEQLIESIVSGNYPLGQLEEALNKLKEPLSATQEQLNDLRLHYYKSALGRLSDTAKKTLDTIDYGNYQTINTLDNEAIALANAEKAAIKLYFSESTPDPALLQKIQDGVTILDQINTQNQNIETFKQALAFEQSGDITNFLQNGWTPPAFFNDVYKKLSEYNQNLLDNQQFQDELSNLKSAIDYNNSVKDKVIKIPNLVGMTLKAAQADAEAKGYKLGISGLSTSYSLPSGYFLSPSDHASHDLKNVVDDRLSTISTQDIIASGSLLYLFKGQTINVTLNVVTNPKLPVSTAPSSTQPAVEAPAHSSNSSSTSSSSKDESENNSDNSSSTEESSTTEQPGV